MAQDQLDPYRRSTKLAPADVEAERGDRDWCGAGEPVSAEIPKTSQVWADSDWAGVVETQRSGSGGWIEVEGNIAGHWSELHSDIALSRRGGELNAVVRDISEGINNVELLKELYSHQPQMEICIDAAARKGMLLHNGVGGVKQLT